MKLQPIPIDHARFHATHDRKLFRATIRIEHNKAQGFARNARRAFLFAVRSIEQVIEQYS